MLPGSGSSIPLLDVVRSAERPGRCHTDYLDTRSPLGWLGVLGSSPHPSPSPMYSTNGNDTRSSRCLYPSFLVSKLLALLLRLSP